MPSASSLFSYIGIVRHPIRTQVITASSMKLNSISTSVFSLLLWCRQTSTFRTGWILPLSKRTFTIESMMITAQRRRTRRNRQDFGAFENISPSSLLFSTATVAEVDAVAPSGSLLPIALQPTGKVVSEGSIVAEISGGLVAVRVRDGHKDDQIANPSPTGELPNSLLDGLQNSDSNKSGDDFLGRQVVFPNGKVGVVLAERSPIIFCLTESTSSSSSSTIPSAVSDRTTAAPMVQVLSSMANVLVPDDHLHRHVDCFGRSLVLDHETSRTTTIPATSASSSRAMFAPIPKVKDIALINRPMVTGTTMIDALAPVGKGQNMLVIGHDLVQMRGFVRDLFATQQREGRGTKCVYGITHDNEHQLLNYESSLEDVIVVSSRQQQQHTNGGNDDKVCQSAEAVAIAATACAIGESYALQGMDALVVVDTIDLHKTFFDTTTRVLVDVYGVDAVVQDDREGGASSEMRAFYSSLIQRAGQYNSKNGGGSVTLVLLTTIPRLPTQILNSMDDEERTIYSIDDFSQCSDKIKSRLDLLVQKNIPLTAANLRKIQIPIPSVSEGRRRLILQHVDDLISMSDGQIWLDESLEDQGQRPPLDPQRSITRIGIGADTVSRADAPAIRKVVEGLRLDLAQAASMDGADITTKASRKQALKRYAWLLAMHQEPGRGGRTIAESCIALMAASRGYLDETIEKGGLAGSALGERVICNLLNHVKAEALEATLEIDHTLDLTPESSDAMERAIASHFSEGSSN